MIVIRDEDGDEIAVFCDGSDAITVTITNTAGCEQSVFLAEEDAAELQRQITRAMDASYRQRVLDMPEGKQ